MSDSRCKFADTCEFFAAYEIAVGLFKLLRLTLYPTFQGLRPSP